MDCKITHMHLPVGHSRFGSLMLRVDTIVVAYFCVVTQDHEVFVTRSYSQFSCAFWHPTAVCRADSSLRFMTVGRLDGAAFMDWTTSTRRLCPKTLGFRLGAMNLPK